MTNFEEFDSGNFGDNDSDNDTLHRVDENNYSKDITVGDN